MEIKKGFKFRIKMTPEIEDKLFRQIGCVRKVWNLALHINQHRLDNRWPILWYDEMAHWLKEWKKTNELAFLKEVAAQPLQQTLMSLAKAYKDAFDKNQPNKRMPVVKKRHDHWQSCRFPQGFKIEGRRLFLPKIGWVIMHQSREIVGTPKNVTVGFDQKYWYVSIQTEIQVPDPKHPSASIIGIDRGVARFAQLSNGDFVKPRNVFKVYQSQLARAQRQLAKKQKFSNNWKKQKQKIGAIHRKVANTRRDFLHKVSTKLSQQHACLVIEDLKIKNMSASAKGTMEKPGKNVKAKSGLNRSILDQGWGEFGRQLNYKQQWRGGLLIKVPPHYTSQTCPQCGHVCAQNRESQAKFLCAQCGYTDHADLVGAINILAAGQALLAGAVPPKGGGAVTACGESVRLGHSMKQEPVRNREKVSPQSLTVESPCFS